MGAGYKWITIKVSDKYEKNIFKWFDHIERMNDDRTAKQVYEGRHNVKVKRKNGWRFVSI